MKLPRLSFRWAVPLCLTVTLLLPVVAVGGAVLVALAVTALPSDAALRVDGITVTKSALKQRVQLLGALYGVRAPTDPAKSEEFDRAIAHTVALRIVLDEAIAQRHLVVTDTRAHQLLTEFIAHGVNPPGQQAFVALLRDTGASEADVVDELKRQDSTRALIGQVTTQAATPVSEAQVLRYYQTHRGDMVRPEQRHLRNIVVASRDDAATLLAEIQRGTDFAATAKRSSLDEQTRANGGDLGSLSADQLDDRYRGPAFSAAPGAVFGPVQTSEGWNIGQVVGLTPPVQVGLGEVHDQLAEWLRQQRITHAWQAWLERKLATADVRYADQYRPVKPGDSAVALGIDVPR